MNLELVEKIANAVLYEGYMLYPYRASAVKNRQRFNWGVLTPQSYSEAQRGTENYSMQTEVFVIGNQNTTIDVRLRFLHLTLREVHEFDDSTSEFHHVPYLEVDGEIFQTWQEAVERKVDINDISLNEITEQRRHESFSFSDMKFGELLSNANGKKVGVIVRTQESVKGVINVQCSKPDESKMDLFKVSVNLYNTAHFESAASKSRDEALSKSLVSTHLILSVNKGEFVSLLEPSEELSGIVSSCKNVGAFPVLVGEKGERDCILSSPIILYDYPQIASESAGELFDGTEIDEILTLRIMTMTDEEKREMRSIDRHARKILERTETLPPEQMMKLHGAMRGLSRTENEQQ